jgi:hypothetical protein
MSDEVHGHVFDDGDVLGIGGIGEEGFDLAMRAGPLAFSESR